MEAVLRHQPSRQVHTARVLHGLLVAPYWIVLLQHSNRGAHIFLVHHVLIDVRTRAIAQHLQHLAAMLLQLRVLLIYV
jgi:hypothetical protein